MRWPPAVKPPVAPSSTEGPDQDLRAERRCLPRRLLMAKDVGFVIGAGGAGREAFSMAYRFGPVLPNQFQQFGKLRGKGAIGIGYIAQMAFQRGPGDTSRAERSAHSGGILVRP